MKNLNIKPVVEYQQIDLFNYWGLKSSSQKLGFTMQSISNWKKSKVPKKNYFAIHHAIEKEIKLLTELKKCFKIED